MIGYGAGGMLGEMIGADVRESYIELDQAGLATAQNARIVIKRDPLILDLNGDGKYTSRLEDGTHFDFAGDGYAEKSGWISEGDGLLVRDVNGNEQIDDGTELFGDRTVLESGATATTGFVALGDVDSNGDGMINAEDEVWDELKVWQDTNGDGIAQSEELSTMEQLTIKEIGLTATSTNRQENGNVILRVGSFTTEDGEKHSVAEVNFSMDTMDTVYKNEVEVPEEILELPNLIGSGNLKSLHQAMAVDEELVAMVKAFAESDDYVERVA